MNTTLIQSYSSFTVYHISQFFNDTEPKPYWSIDLKTGEKILKWDWNKSSLILLIDTKDESQNHIRFLQHYSLNIESMKSLPNLVGNIQTPHAMWTDIKLFDETNIFAVTVKNGVVLFYSYSTSSSSSYQIIHLLNITKIHKEEIKSKQFHF